MTKAQNRRQAAKETRDNLRGAGMQLAVEMFRSGLLNPLRLLSPQAIADKASHMGKTKVTRGMLYHLWPLPDDEGELDGPVEEDRLDTFHVELLRRLFAENFAPDEFENQLRDLLSADPPLPMLIRTMANFQFSRYGYNAENEQDRDRYRFSTLLAATGDILRRHGKLRDRHLKEIREREAVGRMNSLYREVLDHYKMEIIPPLGIEDLNEMLWSIQDGFTLNSWHFDGLNQQHELDEWGDEWNQPGPGWTPYAIASYALISSVIQPKTSSDTGS